MAVSGHYAYTTAYWAGQLTAVDISNPAAPTVVGSSASAPSLENAVTVAISGNYAYVVSKNRNASASSNDDGTGNALTILDIHTDPTTPRIVGSVSDASSGTQDLFGAYGIAVQGSVAYVAYQGTLSGQPMTPDTSTGGFTVVDISSPATPHIVGNIDNGSLTGAQTNDLWHADSVALSGHTAYVAASYSHAVTAIDISTTTPTIIGRTNDPARLHFANDVAIQGNYAYVASQTNPAGKLTIVDISNPVSLKVVGSVSDAALNEAYRVRVRGNFAFVSSLSADTVAMIDVSNPAGPKIVGTVHDPAHLHSTTGLDITIAGRYLIASSPYRTSETSPKFPPYPVPGGSGPQNTGTISAIDLDPSPVSVNITRPGTNSQYRRGQLVNAAYSCVPGGFFAMATCTGSVSNGAPIDTATTGKHTFTVTGTDQAGQTGTTTVTYVVGGPMVTGLKQSAHRWREHGPRAGTTFTIKLSQSAKITLMFTKNARGRLVGGRCVAQTKKNRHRPSCVRTSVFGKLTVNGHKGSNKVRFAGRVNGKLLKPGRYTLVVTATAGGVTSARQTISFTIVA